MRVDASGLEFEMNGDSTPFPGCQSLHGLWCRAIWMKFRAKRHMKLYGLPYRGNIGFVLPAGTKQNGDMTCARA